MMPNVRCSFKKKLPYLLTIFSLKILYLEEEDETEKKYLLMIKSNYTATPMAHPPPGSSSGFTGAWPIPSEMPYSDHRDTSCYGLQNFVTTLREYWSHFKAKNGVFSVAPMKY